MTRNQELLNSTSGSAADLLYGLGQVTYAYFFKSGCLKVRQLNLYLGT